MTDEAPYRYTRKPMQQDFANETQGDYINRLQDHITEIETRIEKGLLRSRRALVNLLPQHRGISARVLSDVCEILRGKA